MKRVLFLLCVITSVMTGCKKDDVAKVLANSITISVDKLNMFEGEESLLEYEILPADVTDKTISWATSDESIATISKEGLVTAITAGQASITVTTLNNKIATCNITVEKVGPKPVSPCIFTNNTDKDQTISLMGSEVTYCEIDGVIKEIKKSTYEPDANIPNNLKTVKQIASFRKKQLLGLEPSEFIVPIGKSIKFYDQTKIECIWTGEFTTDSRFSKWTGLVFWSSGDFHCPGFDFRNSPDLDVILIQYAPSIKHIDISNCTKLQYYTVAVSNVDIADFSKCTKLKHCACVNSTVKRIDISNSPMCFMVIVGADVDAPGALEEVILCPELQETGQYWFSWNNKATTYPENFIVRFLINKDPNTPGLEKRYKQVFDCLAYSEFDGKYVIQTKEGDSCWNFDPEASIWSQKGGDVSDNYYDMSFYKGDLNENGTGYYWSNIISKDLVWDDSSSEYSGIGFIALIDFNSTIAKDADHAIPAEGIYTVGRTSEAMTVNDGYDSFITYYENGKSTEKELKSGTLEIKYENDKIIYICDFILNDDSVFKLNYTKCIKFLNRTAEGKHSNISDDKILTDLTKGKIIYWGNQYEDSDMYNIILAGNNYDLDTNEGNANALNLTINAALNSKGELPTGEYKIINSADESFPVNTALSGMYMPKYNMFWGCMFYNNAKQEEAAITEGVITITNNGDKNYSVVVDCKDGYNHLIKGTYTGTFGFQKESASNYKFKK